MSGLDGLLSQLDREHGLAPAAAVASDAADHFDTATARALAAGDPAVVAWAVGHVGDRRPVRMAAPPHDTLEGGYGRSFGTVTVGDKARFLLRRLLPPAEAEAAEREGQAWLSRALPRLRWDRESGRFTLG